MSDSKTPLSINDKWLKGSLDQLIPINFKDMKLIERFIELGTPVLKKCKSGFLADTGDIQFCLLIHLEDDGRFQTEVCVLGDDGELVPRIKEENQAAINIIKSFIIDHPNAVLTTQERKPLCIFSSKNESLKEKSDAAMGGSGIFVGYMTFNIFKKAVSNPQNVSKLIVAVP